MNILIVSDAWTPQINGVVRTLEATTRELQRLGHSVHIEGPVTASRRTVPLPFYPDIALEFFATARLRKTFDVFQPDLVHVATEGPLGWSARKLCRTRKQSFTTAYHTRFPEYLAARMPWGLRGVARHLATNLLRRFHAPSCAVMVATASMERELAQRRFQNLARWSRGVDTDVFRLYGKNLPAYATLPRPILLCVGRVAAEKNLPAFLALKTQGSKVVIGDGPDLPRLRAQFPEVHFLGRMDSGDDLARHYAAADLFVFPSTTDTFGLVLLEAAAAGLRIASMPAPGPADIFADPEARAFAVLNPNLQHAVDQALALPDDPEIPRRFATTFSWKSCTQDFLHHHQTATI